MGLPSRRFKCLIFRASFVLNCCAFISNLIPSAFFSIIDIKIAYLKTVGCIVTLVIIKAMLLVTNEMKGKNKCFRIVEVFLTFRYICFSCGSPLILRI